MRALLLSGCVGWVAGPGAAQMPSLQAVIEAPPAPDLVTAHGDWQRVCPAAGEARACRLEPGRPLADGLVLEIVAGADSMPVMVVATPEGVLLAEGVAVTVDGVALGRLGFRSCAAGRCLAPVRLVEPLAPAMRRGLVARLEAVRTDGVALSAEVSLIGLTAGLAALLR